MFAVHLITARGDTLFNRKMLADRNLVTAMGFMVVIGVVMFASMALLPPMLQTLFGWPVIDTGIILAVRGVGILMSMWVAGQLLGRIDARWLVGTGLLVAAYSLWQMSHWSPAMGMEPGYGRGSCRGRGCKEGEISGVAG